MDSKSLALAAALVLASPLAHAGGVSAADKETARTLMDEGGRLRAASDLKGALQRFVAADQIMQVPTTGYEVAATELALGNLVEASDAATRVLTVSPSAVDPPPFKAARKKAQAMVDSLVGRIPSVTIVIHSSDAATGLVIDGAAVPPAVVGLPRSVNPGHHVIAVTTSHSSGNAEVDVAEGEKKELVVPLTVTAVASSSPPDDHEDHPPAPVETGHGGRTAAFVSFGVGGAALIAGGVMGVLTLTTRSDIADKCPNHVCGPAQAGELSDGNTFALVSTITFAVGGAALVVGVVALLVGHKSPPAQTQGAHVVPWIGPSGAGVYGRF